MGFYYPTVMGRYFPDIESLLKSVKVEEVQEIYCDGQSWDPQVLRLKHLRKLVLKDFSQFGGVIRSFEHLEELDMFGYAKQDAFSFTILLPQLKRLTLSRNYYRAMSEESFASMKNLEQLNLAALSMGTFPEKILNLKNLKNLHLVECEFDTLPDSIRRLENLEVLELSRNRIKKIEAGIGALKSLKKLYLDENFLKTLPEEIGNLSELVHLKYTNGRLTSLPKTIGQLQNLVLLNVRRNKIKTLPDEISKCKSLKKLYLEHNQLEKLPEQMSNLENLEELFLRKNKLTNLPPDLAKFKQLQYWDIAENPLNWETLAFDDEVFRKYMLAYIYQLIQKKANANLSDQLQHFPPTLAKNPLQSGAVVAITGRTNFKIKTLKPALEALGIQYEAKLNKRVTHLIMGRLPKFSLDEILNHSLTFITEAQVNQYLTSQQAPDPSKYLLQENTQTPDNIQNLKGLLLSSDASNVALAVELMNSGGFPKELHTELFMAYKLVEDASVKQNIKPWLEQHSSEKAKEAIRQRFSLYSEHMDEAKLRRNINKYTKDNELDGPKIAGYFWKNYKKGILYLFSYGSSEQIMEVLPQGDTLDLSMCQVNILPEELVQLTQLRKVILSECNFSYVPKVLFKMPWIEELALDKNYLFRLSPEMVKLTNLRYLYLDYNQFQAFPEVLLKMPQLKKITIKNWYESYMDKETVRHIKEKLPDCELIY